MQGGSRHRIQPVELSNAVGQQSLADRFFDKRECALCLTRFGFGLLRAKLGGELLVHVSADIGLSLREGPIGSLELLVHRSHQLAIGLLGAFRSDFGFSHLLGSLPAQILCAGFGFARPILRGAKCISSLIHQIKSDRGLVRSGR